MGRIVARAARIIAAVVLSLFALVIAAAVVTSVFFGWNGLKSPLASAISAAIGRTLTIAGDLDVDLGRVTRVRLNDVSLANAPWAKEPEMAKVGVVDVSVDLSRLINGDIVLPSLSVTDTRVLLEKNANGEANWQLSTQPKSTQSKPTQPAKREELPVISNVAIENSRLLYRDAKTDRNIDLNLARLTGGSDEQGVRAEAEGAYQQRPLTLKMSAGPLNTLRSEGEPYPLDIHVVVGDFKGDLRGTTTAPQSLEGLDITLAAKGEDLSNLYPITGVPIPPSPPYQLTGRLSHEGTAWRFSDFEGQMGGSDMRGTVAVDLAGERPRMDADVSSKMLDFKDLAGFIGAKPKGEDEGYAAKGDEAAKRTGGGDTKNDRGDKVLPDNPIDLSRLKAMDADVSFSGERILAPDLPIDRLNTKMSLESGTLRLAPADFQVGDGSVRLYLSLYGSKSPVDVDVDARIDHVDLKQLMRGSDFAQESAGRFAGKLKFSSQGTSVAEILGTANGDFFLAMSDGRISHLLVELAGLNIANALGLVITGDKPVPIRCIIGEFKAKDGIFTSQTMIFDTSASKIVGEGQINMRAERLDLKVYPYAKEFSPLSLRSPFDIDGTFKQSSVFPDPAGIGSRTLAQKVLNAILTPAIGLLPPIDAGLGSDSACGALIEEAKQATGQPR